jgi:hypothetical protein
LVFTRQLEHDLVQIGLTILAIAMCRMDRLYVRLPDAVIVAIDVKARPVEMAQGRDQSEALGSSIGHATLELRHRDR